MASRFALIFLLIAAWTQSARSSIIVNQETAQEKLVCYGCQGSNCEKVDNDGIPMVLCNRYTQLCWAGFVNQKPYRTCASRFCTPNGISLDSDVRIETCCHSNLCNSVELSWAAMSPWYKRPTSALLTPAVTAPPPTTPLPTPVSSEKAGDPVVYVVEEITDNLKESVSDPKEKEHPIKLLWNASNPASFGINWDPVHYEKGFSSRIESVSRLVIFFIPILLALIF